MPSTPSLVVSTRDGNIYAVDGQTAAHTQIASAPTKIERGPVLHKKTIINRTPQGLHLVNTETGSQTHFTWRGNLDTDIPVNRLSFFTPYDGLLYTGVDHDFYAVDLTGYDSAWEYSVGIDDTVHPPAVDDKAVYIPTDQGVVYARDRLHGGELWAQNLETPSQSYPTPQIPVRPTPTLSSPSLNGSLYLALGQSIYALAKTDGSILWENTVQGTLTGRLTLHKDHLYASTQHGSVYQIESDTGNILWERALHEETPIYPITDDTSLYLLTEEGLYSLTLDHGSTEWARAYSDSPVHNALQPLYSHGTLYASDYSTNSIYFLSPETGKQLWSPERQMPLQFSVQSNINEPIVTDQTISSSSN